MKRLPLAICAALLATVITLIACGNAWSDDKRPHNQVDVSFAQHMIPHHQQAVQMSDTVLAKQGVDPQVATLANAVKAAQGPEIQQMQGWLSDWGEPTTIAGPRHNMPGMVSEADIAALQNAQGAQAGTLFLTQMIAHHQGAVAMAQDEIASGQYPPAVAMAHSIVTSQQQEIADMQRMLAAQ